MAFLTPEQAASNNIFAYGGNTVNSQTGQTTAVQPTASQNQPAVMTSTPATTSINQANQYLNNYTQQPTPNPSQPYAGVPQAPGTTYQAPTQTTNTYAGVPQAPGTTPPQQIINSPSANKTYQSIVEQMNALVSNPAAAQSITPEMRAQISRINGLAMDAKGSATEAQAAFNNKKYELGTAKTNETKKFDDLYNQALSEFRASAKILQDQALAALLPSQGENDLNQQLNDLKTKQQNFDLETERQKEGQMGLGRPLALSLGQQGKIGKDRAFDRAQMAIDEGNLIGRLGIAQNNRDIQSKIAEKGLDFLLKDATFAQQVLGAQEDREQRLFDNTLKYDQLQRNVLADTLEQFQNVDPSKASPEVVSQIGSMLSRYGINPNEFGALWQASFDRDAIKRAGDLADIQSKINNVDTQVVEVNGQRVLINSQTGATIKNLGRADTGKATQADLDQASVNTTTDKLVATRGTDGYVSPTAYTAERAKARIGPDEFDKRFSYLLSPQEQQKLGLASGKPPTAAQETVSTYASRIEQANPIIANVQPTITNMNPAYFETQNRLPSYLQTSEFQQYMQAAQNFINATLRRESGAVISASEFDTAYKQYLPRPGDSAATLLQKLQNRQIIQQSFIRGAGSAYTPLDQLIGSTSNSTTSGTTASGINWTIE